MPRSTLRRTTGGWLLTSPAIPSTTVSTLVITFASSFPTASSTCSWARPATALLLALCLTVTRAFWTAVSISPRALSYAAAFFDPEALSELMTETGRALRWLVHRANTKQRQASGSGRKRLDERLGGFFRRTTADFSSFTTSRTIAPTGSRLDVGSRSVPEKKT
jgi:hypothetical protein